MHESSTSRARSRRAPIGIVFGSLTPPETMAHAAGLAEKLGFGELWFSEDCFFSGGMSGAAQILASTDEIPVGLGIVSAVTRHPAVAAMEVAGMARTHPSRVRPGVGLGVRAWLRQMGLMPASPISALREGVLALRGLLDGEEVTLEGETHRLDGVRLDLPPQERLPLYVGAVNGRALRLSGEVADGTVLSVLSGLAYVEWAREKIREIARARFRERPRAINGSHESGGVTCWLPDASSLGHSSGNPHGRVARRGDSPRAGRPRE